jgi:hypothetical protein
MGPADDVALQMIRQLMNTISYTFRRHQSVASIAAEKLSCWSVLSIDGLKIDAKIIHKGRGKFEILEDNYKGKYISKIVDASDVVRCKVEDDKALKPKPAVRFENKYCSKCNYPLTHQPYEQIKEFVHVNPCYYN